MGIKYREDTCEVNSAGQTEFYANWMGGRTLASVGACKCPDGQARKVYMVGDSNAPRSIAAAVSAKRKTITGYVTCDDGVWNFHPTGKNRDLLVKK